MWPSRKNTTRSAKEGEMGLVGDNDGGDSALTSITDHLHHHLAIGRIEGSGGLVGQEEMALSDNGPGDGHSLALAARELIGVVIGSFSQPEALKGSHGRQAGLSHRDAVELQGQRDVFCRT